MKSQGPLQRARGALLRGVAAADIGPKLGAVASLMSYGLSAVVFVGFSVLFVRWYGAGAYGGFSLLLNTVSALTLFGNFHGTLVSYSVASDPSHYRSFSRIVGRYALGASLVATLVLTLVGGLPWIYAPLLAVGFWLLIFCGLPSAALLATSHNYLFNVVRGVYQLLIVGCFWAVYAWSGDLPESFVAALLIAALANFLTLNYLGRTLISSRENAPEASTSLMFAALATNLAMMATLLVDKFALSFLRIGTPEDRGVFLLYLDVIGRLSSVFIILLPSFTYYLLQPTRDARAVVRSLAFALAVAAGTGALALGVGYGVIPALYSISLDHIRALPGVMALYIALFGVTSVVVAYCNARGLAWTLTANYALMLLITIAALLAPMLLRGGELGVVDLATALALGQAGSMGVGAYLIAHRGCNKLKPE
ncbi:MAG: hypothetical protein JWN93_3745 [Hyphomicrobiales bacterium]|nr:hypothetical protein [Hyphomicrobiales bacterium]